MKILFIIGQCVRMLHSDPWDMPTFKIEEVGKYSYRTSTALDIAPLYPLEGYGVLHFDRQAEFEVVQCPKTEK